MRDGSVNTHGTDFWNVSLLILLMSMSTNPKSKAGRGELDRSGCEGD